MKVQNDNQITISKNLVINGNGHSISGNKTIQIFKISGGNIVLNNLSLEKGFTDDSDGGAIYVESASSLTLNYVTFTDNYADNNGAAIFISPNCIVPVYCNYCDFINNVVDDDNGGAIYAHTPLYVSNCNFDNNKALDDTIGTKASGGAIYAENSVDVVNSKFSNNGASAYGGAIFSKNKVNVKNSIFEANSVPEAQVQCCGGAIYSELVVTVEDSDFSDNYADDYGGAIYALQNVNIYSSMFSGNIAYKNEGGAVYSKTTITLINSIFYNNKGSGIQLTQSYGGAIRTERDVIVENSSFEANSICDYGGAIAADGSVHISSSNFTSNVAGDNDGGAIYAQGDIEV